MSRNTLPIILVSATDLSTACTVISKLVDNEVGEEEGIFPEGSVRWRLQNKYYTADVRVWPLAHGGEPPPAQLLEAHVIYLTEDECAAADGGARRAGERARAAGGEASVQLVLAARPAPALRRWAAAARHELLAWPAGARRARHALHAHVWPGLARAPRPGDENEPEAGEEDEAEAGEEDEAEAGEEDEAESAVFAAALGALGGAAAHARSLRGAARLEAAEQVVAAFCRALGCDIDAC